LVQRDGIEPSIHPIDADAVRFYSRFGFIAASGMGPQWA
jgi:hypothetical protein